MYIHIAIRGPQEHQLLTGSSIYTLRPSAATYYHNRIYTYVVYGAVSHSLSDTIATPIADLPDGDRGPNLNKFVPRDMGSLIE